MSNTNLEYIPEYAPRVTVVYDEVTHGHLATKSILNQHNTMPGIEITNILIDGKESPLLVYETLKEQHGEDWKNEIKAGYEAARLAG